MQKCPVEIVEAIISRASSKADLLNLRIVNKPFHDLVTPKVFRSVDVRNSVESVMRLVQIRECERLVQLVEEILFDSRVSGTVFEINVQGLDIFDEINEEKSSKLLRALSHCFCGLHEFHSLHTLHLSFWPSFLDDNSTNIQEQAEEFITRQLLVLDAIMVSPQGPPPFKTFTIINGLHLQRLDFGYIPLVKTLPSVTSFNLTLLSDMEWFRLTDGLHGVSFMVDKWTLTVNNPYLAPLESLYICCERGLVHFEDLEQFGLDDTPLTALSLDSVILQRCDGGPQGSMEEFIVTHKATLKKLEIKGCVMLYEARSATRLWSEMWERLNTELVELVELVVLADTADDTVPLKYSSRLLIDNPHYFEPSRMVKDMLALEKFKATVSERKRCMFLYS